jgi:hypothetical protein
MTRRMFVAGLGVAAGALLWGPRLAVADEAWWAGETIFRGNGAYYGDQFWREIGVVEVGDGGAQGGTMYTDRWVCAKTPWVEWDISASQFIRTATKITMRCDFCTELYYHVVGKLEIACGSYNGLDASYNLWHPDSGDDTRYTLLHRTNGQPEGGFVEDEHVVVIDNEVGEGRHQGSGHIWTDYRSYPGADYSVWIRREPTAALHSFQLKSSFWNYYYYGTKWYSDRKDNPPISFTTPWVDQHADRIMIASNLAWANRVLTVSVASHPAKCLAVPQAKASAEVQCVLATNERLTSQQWIAEANTGDAVGGTLRFIPVHLGNGSLSLDQRGGGPTKDPSAAELWYTESQNRAQAMWVHGDGSTQWLFSDCSGMALDRVDGASNDGAGVQFHSDGYPGNEWSNASHWWSLADARFGSQDGKPLDIAASSALNEITVGTTLSVQSWEKSLKPREKLSGGSLADSGIVHEYDWIVSSDSGAWLAEAPEIVGRAHLLNGGWLSQQPAAGLIGTIGQGLKVDDLQLSVEGSSLSGSIDVGKTGSGGIETVSLRATGDLGTRFYVEYGVHIDGSGWSGWVRDGAIAGRAGTKISGLRAVLRHRDVKLAGTAKTTLTVGDEHRGKYIACVARARTRYGSIPYRGAAVSNPVHVLDGKTQVNFFVDGSTTPCWRDSILEGKSYRTPSSAEAVGQKEGCAKFEGWFTDRACTKRYVQGSPMGKGQLNLYGRNMARVTYRFAQQTDELFANYTLFTDERMSHAADASTVLPAEQLVAWGSRVHAESRQSLWYEAHGQVREATAVAGIYLSADESTQPTNSVRITADTTLYVAWRLARYEGIEVS